MAKHEYWWPCRILGVDLADEGFERVTLRLTGRRNLSHQNSQYSDTQRHQKHQTTPRIPQPSLDIFNNTTWRRVLASLASRYAQQTKNTLCISIMLKSWPQSTGKQNDFSSFFFFKPLQAWLVREQTAVLQVKLPACCLTDCALTEPGLHIVLSWNLLSWIVSFPNYHFSVALKKKNGIANMRETEFISILYHYP